VVVAPTYEIVIPVRVFVPPVQLLKVLPVIVFAGLVPAPSVLLMPVSVVAPVTVIFEKLLCTIFYPIFNTSIKCKTSQNTLLVLVPGSI